MGCGASSGGLKKSPAEATALPDEPTAKPEPEDPKADAEKKEEVEAEKKEVATKAKPVVEEIPTREPSEQQEQEPVPAPASGEKPEDLQAWGMELGEGGASAATKLQSAHRGKQARGEVEKMKQTKNEQAKEKEEPVAATEAAKEAVPATGEAPAKSEAANSDSPEELQAWASELGEGGGAAATKLQATHRGKQARAEVEKMKAVKQPEEPAKETPGTGGPEVTAAEDLAAGPGAA